MLALNSIHSPGLLLLCVGALFAAAFSARRLNPSKRKFADQGDEIGRMISLKYFDETGCHGYNFQVRTGYNIRTNLHSNAKLQLTASQFPGRLKFVVEGDIIKVSQCAGSVSVRPTFATGTGTVTIRGAKPDIVLHIEVGGDEKYTVQLI